MATKQPHPTRTTANILGSHLYELFSCWVLVDSWTLSSSTSTPGPKLSFTTANKDSASCASITQCRRPRPVDT